MSDTAMQIRTSALRTAGELRRLFWFIAALCLVAVILTAETTPVSAQSSLTPDVREALTRMSNGTASETDKALLFSRNREINAAGQNGEIADDLYQKAQGAYDAKSQSIAKDAADAADAKFRIQDPSSQTYVPGTDSDYITQVKSKDQIARMQADYNRRVNQYMKDHGVPETRSDWHNKLDVDFMADPEFITDPEEFREIARMNNDAYKNRYAAEYEAISRSKNGGKIGPRHVEGYMNEMRSFADKKGRKVQDILSKGPSYLNDPLHRAELFQAMAQEQKYTSRLESLDDFLRAQEGLPPRNRGLSISKAGSNRSATNAANVRRANAVADSSRLAALEDLAETMGQVSKKNPAFNPNAADDIARLVEGLPSDRRAGVLSRIRANGNPGLVDDVLAASRRAGRLPPGTSLADDMARASLDDLARFGGKLDDAADIGKARRALSAASSAMDALGRIAATAEVALAASQLAELFDLRSRIMDPDISDEEAASLIERAGNLARNLADSSMLVALTERYPAVAVAYGTWSLACAGGEWVSPTKNPLPAGARGSNCLDRQVRALDRAHDWWTGKDKQREAQSRGLCDKFIAAVKEGRLKPSGSFSVKNVCDAIRYRLPIGDMVERVVKPEDETEPEKKPEPSVIVAATCDADKNADIITGLRQAAQNGSADAISHIARVEAINDRISGARSALASARQSYAQGNMDAARSDLDSAKSTLEGIAGGPDCSELIGKIVTGLDKVERLGQHIDKGRSALDSCDSGRLEQAHSRYQDAPHPELQNIAAQAGNMIAAQASYLEAKTQYAVGNLAGAEASLNRAIGALDSVDPGNCSGLREDLTSGLARIDKLRNAIRAAEQAVVACNIDQMELWRGRFSKVSNPAAAAIRNQLERGEEVCRDRQRDERIAASNQSCRASFGDHSYATRETAATDKPQCGCKSGYQWNTGQTKCVKGPTEDQLAADRERNCRQKFGKGFYPGPVNSKGVYYCRPTQAVANARCRAANDNGVVASKVRADGSYTCRRSAASQRQIALDSCRRKYGRSFIRLIKKGGRYLCEHGQRRTAQPSHSSQNSAAVVGAIGGIIGAIGNASNRRSNEAPRVQQRTPRRSSGGSTPARRQGPKCRSHMSSTSKYFINQTDPRCF